MTKTRSHARELFYYSQLLFIIFIVFAILIQHLNLNSHEHCALKVQLSSTFSEPRKEKTDSSNGNNNALSAQDYHHQYQLQQSQLQQHHQQSPQLPQVQQPNNGDSQHHKPERPNSFGPKINKRVFYHDTCKLTTRSMKIIALNSSTGRVTCHSAFFYFRHYRQPTAR